jgi:heterotetrameric sarcosine oxidase gamma subunit
VKMGAEATTLSALQQEGYSELEFRRSTLRVHEVSKASLLRLHALDRIGCMNELSRAGVQLPAQVGQTTGHDPRVMCLRPGEWLVFSESASAADLREHLGISASSDSLAVLDFSDGLAIFRISGTAAPWLLAKLSGLDFVGSRDAGPHCARTRLGQVAVIVHYHAASESSSEFVYDLMFDRSIARYVWELLQHSADHAAELQQTMERASATVPQPL